jgi:hypothetical protein
MAVSYVLTVTQDRPDPTSEQKLLAGGSHVVGHYP